MAEALSLGCDDISLEAGCCQGYNSKEESEKGFSDFWLTSPIYPCAWQTASNGGKVCLTP